MVTKIVVTLLVILGAYFFLRWRGQRMAPPLMLEGKSNVAPKAAGESRSKLPRLLTYAIPLILVVASGLFFYLEWRDQYRVISVRVINTHTGGSVTYQARRGDVDGRSFRTLDGQTVNVAEVERMEFGGKK